MGYVATGDAVKLSSTFNQKGLLAAMPSRSASAAAAIAQAKKPVKVVTGVKEGSSRDPIANFARSSARATIVRLGKLEDPEDRKVAMKTVLDTIDPSLDAKVENTYQKLLKDKKYAPKVALEKALAITLANRFIEEAVKLGRSGAMPLGGLLGLGCWNTADYAALEADLEDLGSIWGSIKKAAKKTVKTVGKGAKAVGKGVKKGVKATGKGIKKGAKAVGKTAKKVGKAIKKGAKAVANATVDVLKAIGKGVCIAANSGALDPLLSAGGAAGAGVLGVPPQVGAQAGSAGGSMLKGVCPQPKEPVPDPAPPAEEEQEEKSSFPIVPVAIAGGVGLIAILAMSRK